MLRKTLNMQHDDTFDAIILLSRGSYGRAPQEQLNAMVAAVRQVSAQAVVLGAMVDQGDVSLPTALQQAASAGARQILVQPVFIPADRNLQRWLAKVIVRWHRQRNYSMLRMKGTSGRLVVLALWLTSTVALALFSARTAYAMHIMEGFLSPAWAAFWFAVAIPFWVIGFIQIRRLVKEKPESRLMLGLAGAFAFVLSALKLPSVTGSCSHPTGTGLGAILFGPFVMSILGGIVLLFQALLLAHGGLTTLGANTVSMGIVGPLVAWGV